MPASLANVARSRLESDVWHERDRRTGPTVPAPDACRRPGVYLWRMFVFLVLVGLLIAVLHRQLVGGDAQQPGPQLPDLLRAGRRHPLRLPAGPAALSRDPLGQRLPHRRPGPRHLAPPGAAGADGHHAARPHRLAVAVGHLHALDHGFDRRAASTRRATPAAISSACWCSSACSAPSGACSTPSPRSARPSAPSTPGPPTASPCSTS